MKKRVKNQNHTCTIHRKTTNSFIPLGSNIQFSTSTKKLPSNNKKKLVTSNGCKYKIQYYLKKRKAARIEYPEIRVNAL
jgi:hypothetical protein